VWWDGEERAIASLCVQSVFLEFVKEVDAVVLHAASDVECAHDGGFEDGVVAREAGFGAEVGEGCCCCWSCDGQGYSSHCLCVCSMLKISRLDVEEGGKLG